MAKRSSKSATAPVIDDRVRIAILHGEEYFLVREYTSRLKAALETAHGGVEVFTFDGQTTEPAEVLDECRSFALMTPAKLVIVDDADKFVTAQTRPMLERYADNPTDRATLLLRARTWRKGRFEKKVEAGLGFVHKCDHVPAPMAAGWVRARCQKRYDARIGVQAAAVLVERVGSNLSRLDSELAKLALASGLDGEITPELINETIGISREEEAWGIQEVILSGNADAAIGKVRELVRISRQPEQLITYFINDMLRKIVLMAAAQAQGENQQGLGKELKLWGPRAAAVADAARRLGVDNATQLFDRALEADARAKSGRGNALGALERIVTEICVALR